MNPIHTVRLILSSAILAILAGCCTRHQSGGVDVAIPIIDTHIHLYDTSRPDGVPWPPESDKVLYRPVLSQHFDAVSEANKVTATVIVEASDRTEDNQWVLDLVQHNPRRYIGLVGNLPIGTDEFAGLLERFAAEKRFVGLRMRQRPGEEKFFTEAVWRDLKLMADKGLTLDVLLANFDLKDIDLVARKVPGLKILINHVTGLVITGEPADEAWAKDVRKAASHPNVYCKISGIFQRTGKRPSPKELSFYAPIFKVVYDAFGENRVIYGSNWPVTDRGGEYSEQLSIINEFFEPMGRTVLEKLYWRNASAFYGVKLNGD